MRHPALAVAAAVAAIVAISGVLWSELRRRGIAATPPVRAESRPRAGASDRSRRVTTRPDRVADTRVAAWVSSPLPDGLRRPGMATWRDALRELPRLAPGTDRSRYFQQLISAGLAVDPEAVLDALATMTDVALRDLGVTFALQTWSQRDAAAALDWAARHPRAPNDASRFQAAYEGYAAQQPTEALHLLARPELAANLDALTAIVVYHLEARDRLDDARAWAAELPAGQLRELLVQRIAASWGTREPEAALDWLAATASESDFQNSVGALVRGMALERPSFAAGLAERIAAPERRQQYLADVVYLWSKQDLGSAATWLRAQPASPLLDDARVRMAEATAPLDPAEARAWVDGIIDVGKRTELLRRLHFSG